MFRATIFSVLLLATSTSFATYQCHGVNGTDGKASLHVDANNSIAINATWKWTDDDDREAQHSATCTGTFNRKQHDFKYYDTDKNTICPIDYIRLHKGFKKDGKGMISLVSREGGDTHDNSGYTYAYFFCS